MITLTDCRSQKSFSHEDKYSLNNLDTDIISEIIINLIIEGDYDTYFNVCMLNRRMSRICKMIQERRPLFWKTLLIKQEPEMVDIIKDIKIDLDESSSTFGRFLNSPIPGKPIQFAINYNLPLEKIQNKENGFYKFDQTPFELWKRIIIYGNKLDNVLTMDNIDREKSNRLQAMGAIYPPSRVNKHMIKDYNSYKYIHIKLPCLIKIPDLIYNNDVITHLKFDPGYIHTIPDNIGKLKSLTRLDLSGHFIKDVPKFIINNNIKILILEDNLIQQLSKEIKDHYGTRFINIFGEESYKTIYTINWRNYEHEKKFIAMKGNPYLFNNIFKIKIEPYIKNSKRRNIKNVIFPICEKSEKPTHTLNFDDPITIKDAIYEVENYLNQPLTEEYYNYVCDQIDNIMYIHIPYQVYFMNIRFGPTKGSLLISPIFSIVKNYVENINYVDKDTIFLDLNNSLY